MEKTGQVPWVKRIYSLLEQAGEKDRALKRFGASRHKYKLAETASQKAIEAFEERHKISLPEEYRDFLMMAGNGGAGPYYGLYSLKEVEQAAVDDFYLLQAEPVIYPHMSDEDWDRAADPEDKRESEELYPLAGVLPIGTQGCTYMIGLILHGAYRGQVVYFDIDLTGKPFFVRENGFLAWYERWLREVIAGYEIFWFGMNLDGDERELTEQYRRANTPEEKAEIISSFYKFQVLPNEQQVFIKEMCRQETDLKLRTMLIKLMAHFHIDGLTEQLDELWEKRAYAETISVITYKGSVEIKEGWRKRILEILPQLHGEAFRDACYIIKDLKQCPDIHAGMLKETFKRKKLTKNEQRVLLYCIGELNGREDVVEDILDFLQNETDISLMISAVQAMNGIKDRRLQESCVRLLDQYRKHENAKLDFEDSQRVLKGGGCLAASRYQGQLINNLINRFERFGMDYRGAWRLLMDDRSWEDWKRQNGFV